MTCQEKRCKLKTMVDKFTDAEANDIFDLIRLQYLLKEKLAGDIQRDVQENNCHYRTR